MDNYYLCKYYEYEYYDKFVKNTIENKKNKRSKKNNRFKKHFGKKNNLYGHAKYIIIK